MNRIAILAAFLALGACAKTRSVEPLIVTKEVKVPVIIPCIDPKDVPPRPVYSDATREIAMNIFDKTRLAEAGIDERQARETRLEALIDGCVKQQPGS
jgi:hypothetical protein